MSIMTLTGRPVKRPGKLIGVPNAQILRALRRAKAPAPWLEWDRDAAGLAVALTATGLAATDAAQGAATEPPTAPPADPPVGGRLTWEQVCAAGDGALLTELRRLERMRDEAEARGDFGAVASAVGAIDDIESEARQRRAWGRESPGAGKGVEG